MKMRLLIIDLLRMLVGLTDVKKQSFIFKLYKSVVFIFASVHHPLITKNYVVSNL